MVALREGEKYGSRAQPRPQAPAPVAASTPAAPTTEASTTRPLRNLYMYQPTNSAIGIVQAIVNVPHELPGTSRRAFAGSTSPGPSGFPLRKTPLGTARRNGSWKTSASSGPLPN